MNSNLVKLRIPLDPDWHGGESEWVWAEPKRGDLYALRNVPFFAKNLSFDDVVKAENKDGALTFSGVAERGGHSTYRIMASGGREDSRVVNLVKRLNAAGGEIERATGRLMAVDVLPEANIYEIYALLNEAESEGFIDFQEGHCGHKLRQ